MKTIELFSGTKSFSKISKRHGYEIFTVDVDSRHSPDLCADIRDLTKFDFPYQPDVMWCSPPCQGFSIASVSHHWNKDRTPKSEVALLALVLVQNTLRLIEELNPTWFFIENPRGMLRKQYLLDCLERQTITYCQYGDKRMKPTDIWTNAEWWEPRPPCKNGYPCHEAAPRGSRTGTQGLIDAKDRGVIPSMLFEEIFFQHSVQMKDVAQ